MDTQSPVTSILELGSDEERLAFLAQDSSLHCRSSVESFAHEALQYARVDISKAAQIAEAACSLADMVDDPFSTAVSRRSLAHVQYLLGRCEDSIDLYDTAVRLFRSAGADVEVGKTLSNSLQARILLGQYAEAMRVSEEARYLLEKNGDQMLLARLDCNIGNILHRQDRFEEAMVQYEKALAVFRWAGGDPQSIAAALLNSAVCLIVQNDFVEALSRYEEVSAHCREHGLLLPAVQADYNIAYLHYRRGEYTKAIELYSEAEERCTKVNDPYHSALCNLDLAELYLEVNLTSEAIRLAESAHRSFTELGMVYEASKALVFSAVGAIQKKQTIESLEQFANARKGFSDEGNLPWCGMVDFYRGLVLLDAGRAAEARVLVGRALNLFVEVGGDNRAALCELLLARITLETAGAEEAREHAHSALTRLKKLDLPHLLYQAHFVVGQIEESAGEIPAAWQSYRRAYDLLEDLRSHLGSDELKIAFLKDRQEIYEGLVWLSLREGASDATKREAFTYVENAKSRALADLINFHASSLPPRSRHQGELVDRIRSLRQELNWYYKEIDASELGSKAVAGSTSQGPNAGEAGRTAQLRERSRHSENKLLETLTRVRAQGGDIGSLQMDSFDISAFRSTLPEGAVLLEYYEARGTVFAFVLSSESLHISPVTTVQRVQEIHAYLQFQLSKFRLGGDYVEKFSAGLLEATRAHLAELYDELVRPLRAHLEGDSLVVVPHRALHYIPFHALLDGDSYLIDEMAVSYAPSASVFQMCCESPGRQHERSLVMGIADETTPRILDEVQAVAAELPAADVFLGEEATLETLRRLGSQSRVIHIATHGFFRRDNPMFSALQLGDSRLTLFDIYELDLPAEIVVLSGCGTGLSVVEGGDEIIGLTRGLLYAGAQSVLATLWDTQDDSTATFMSAFYKRLKRQPNRAVALREAMIELRGEYPHPFYWAPFLLSGKPYASSSNDVEENHAA